MIYKVYQVITTGLPRDHHAIFVETQPDDKTGQVFHVTGNIQTGMTYETEPGGRPEGQLTFQSKVLLGEVTVEDYERRFDAVCREVPVPGKQFEGAKRLYPQVRLRRCQEWAEEAVELLRREGMIVSGGRTGLSLDRPVT